MKDIDFDAQVKSKILGVFKYLQKVFEKHHLHYIACGGTVLGAVRHKDFIPWDDDMDIYMPREDYNRLISLSSELKKDGYSVITDETPGYYAPFAKVCDDNTTLWEQKEFPFIMGIYVDIFPLDNFNISDEALTALQWKCSKTYFKYKTSIARYSFSDIVRLFINGKIRDGKLAVKSTLRRPLRNKYWSEYNAIKAEYAQTDGDKTVCVTQWEGKIFKREWFEDTILCDFGDTQVVIPRDFDAYLKLLYGNYMQFPPEKDRHPQHFRYYVNLEKGMTMEEVKKIMS